MFRCHVAECFFFSECSSPLITQDSISVSVASALMGKKPSSFQSLSWWRHGYYPNALAPHESCWGKRLVPCRIDESFTPLLGCSLFLKVAPSAPFSRGPHDLPPPPPSHFINMQENGKRCDWQLPKWLLRASHSTLSLSSNSNVRHICIRLETHTSASVIRLYNKRISQLAQKAVKHSLSYWSTQENCRIMKTPHTAGPL